MELVQSNRSFDGEQRIYRFNSISLQGESRFGIYLPAQALAGQACPTLFYLAGLTCTEETFAIKAHAQRLAAQLGLVLVTPDTSPRGEQVAQGDHWDIGQGAGFYINATQAPWAEHFQMESYIVEELYDLVIQQFAVQAERIGIFGHSMGGHGALTLALKYPEKFKSVSAFAPICAPSQCPWGEKAFSNYLGSDQAEWLKHDATALVQTKTAHFADILIDQGLSDQFYSQLNPALFQQACQAAGQPLTLREHAGYDHGYYFIQSFIDDHLQFHAVQLES
ncbi:MULTISPECIES: S-formylglutathione hydrolase [Acinetobacter]|jgi:S-formylglutathione hydrolase|uniref:S-formylglutathione hydrolase n=1 Tax=Acinetobacter johnsonii TaxID=40214 RepID=A0AAJ6ID99_ACIJO|nr:MULTISPECIES: S-formylglutathione hydrolase [Acinetobacter]MBL4859668.1 S-formylglutathione hydrolase [Acinetobacter sp.]ALV73800.1 S-formylglutathione hydrolase [Acinetobacter johnsonii XBB1]MBV7310128.1 S-formylglutathione hydrolase [Acinetobacter sp. CWB-G5]MCV2451657.1 S-formylglutathione hydrolase [Acinetobacter johnsonii]MDG9787954.1 S-formylglutathione hydrolase [Acinetobacter johnsonii]